MANPVCQKRVSPFTHSAECESPEGPVASKMADIDTSASPTGASAVRVVLIDDHRMLLEGLISVLGREKDIEIIGFNTDSVSGLQQVRELQPDVLVLDITMPVLDGIELCRQLQQDEVRPAVLILSVHRDEQIISQAVSAGASGYLLKDAAAQELAHGIRQVSRGHFFLGDGISAGAIARMAGAAGTPYSRLSAREREVLRLVVEGKNNIEAGNTIGISPKTIDTHKRRILKKLGLESPVELVRFAIREGIIRP